MAEGARITSVEVVRMFRAALIKYAETGNVALTSADGDLDRMMGWLERDQTMYWTGQVRKRHEIVIRCEDAVRQKRLFKGADGGVQSVVDELKALANAKRRKEEAEVKVLAVRKAIMVLRKESQLYKGRVQKLGTTMTSDLPKAVHKLDRMLEQIAEYLRLQTTGKGLDLKASVESMALAASSGGPKSTLEKLRARTPTPEQRQAAPFVTPAADHGVNQPWGAAEVVDWQLRALAGLTIERSVPDPDHRIVAHPDVWQQPKIYLERLDPTGEDDSGWYLGPAGDAEPAPGVAVAYQAMRIGDVIAARKDLADFLALPTLTLAILDTGGPSAIYDGLGLDVWAIALIKADDDGAPPADAPEPATAEPATA
jgi:hypothetical protein